MLRAPAAVVFLLAVWVAGQRDARSGGARAMLGTRAVLPDHDALRVAHWQELFKNQQRIKRLVVQSIASGPPADQLQALLKRRIEDEGTDHHALAVAVRDIKPCSAAATDAGLLYWECSLPQYSSLVPFSPRVAFACVVDEPLDAAVGRFYRAHETDHMKRHVPISKYFRAQARGAFSEEHLQHLRAFVVGGREFLKGSEKYQVYHDLGSAQFRRVASDPLKALEVVKALRMVVAPSSDLDGFLLVLRRRMGWPLRSILHAPLLPLDRPTASDWPQVYAAALNNTPKVRSDWEFYGGVLEIARAQRQAFGVDKYRDQLDELGALQAELVRKCDAPSSGQHLDCMLSTFDRCVVPEGRDPASMRSCGALLRAIGDGDSSFNALT